MGSATRIAGELKKLVDSEKYFDALALLQEEGIGLIDSLPPSPTHRELLFLAARIHVENHSTAQASIWIDKIKTHYLDTEHEVDLVLLSGRILFIEGNYDRLIHFLSDNLEYGWCDSEKYSLMYLLGVTHFYKGDYLKSNRLLAECRDYAVSTQDKCLAGKSEYMLGYIAFQRCFFHIAERYFSKALKSFKIAGRNTQIGRTFRMIGILAYRMGNYSKAEKYLRQAINCYKKCSQRMDIVNSKIAMARVEIFRGRYYEAESLLLESMGKAEEYEYRRGTALSAEFLGEACYNQERYNESLEYLKIAERIAMEIAAEGDIVLEVFRRLGDVLISLGRLDEAADALDRAMKLSSRLKDSYELGSILRAFGILAAERNDIDLAISYIDEAVTTLRMINERFELARTYRVSATLHKRWCRQMNRACVDPAELRKRGQEHALEAVHLFSSLGLDERASECEALHNKLNVSVSSASGKSKTVTLRFDDNWLVEGLLVARSRHTLDVVKRIREIAPSDMSVMITGDTGTGKELAAKLLHKLSYHSGGPFIAVNCAAVPPTVFESEFFGHQRGSFTGAFRDRAGYIECASGGILFLDEVTELSMRQQAKLLRVLDQGTVCRIGETRERSVDVRVISASNMKAQDLFSGGNLRKDFYYRICAEILKLDPLRKRQNDILPLFSCFMDENGETIDVEKEVIDILHDYHWPGNVRELLNLTKGLSLIRKKGKVIRVTDLPLAIRDASCSELGRRSTAGRAAFAPGVISVMKLPEEKLGDIGELIRTSIVKASGNKAAAARTLGISRSTLYRKIKELDLS